MQAPNPFNTKSRLDDFVWLGSNFTPMLLIVVGCAGVWFGESLGKAKTINISERLIDAGLVALSPAVAKQAFGAAKDNRPDNPVPARRPRDLVAEEANISDRVHQLRG